MTCRCRFQETRSKSYVVCKGIEADAFFDGISWIDQCCQYPCDSCHDGQPQPKPCNFESQQIYKVMSLHHRIGNGLSLSENFSFLTRVCPTQAIPNLLYHRAGDDASLIQALTPGLPSILLSLMLLSTYLGPIDSQCKLQSDSSPPIHHPASPRYAIAVPKKNRLKGLRPMNAVSMLGLAGLQLEFHEGQTWTMPLPNVERSKLV